MLKAPPSLDVLVAVLPALAGSLMVYDSAIWRDAWLQTGPILFRPPTGQAAIGAQAALW